MKDLTVLICSGVDGLSIFVIFSLWEILYTNRQYFQNIFSNFLELNHKEKITKILNPSTPEQIRTVKFT
jgi:hypothetical protein